MWIIPLLKCHLKWPYHPWAWLNLMLFCKQQVLKLAFFAVKFKIGKKIRNFQGFLHSNLGWHPWVLGLAMGVAKPATTMHHSTCGCCRCRCFFLHLDCDYTARHPGCDDYKSTTRQKCGPNRFAIKKVPIFTLKPTDSSRYQWSREYIYKRIFNAENGYIFWWKPLQI